MQAPRKVSAAVISFNEENKIADCLKSVSWADEMLVVDSRSTDRTREIARSLGARVIERDWPGYVNQVNFALESAEHEWVVCIDADERVSEKLKEEIGNILSDPAVVDGYAMPRKAFYINRWITRCGWYPARKVRLVRKSNARWGGVDPHYAMEVKGRVETLSGDIYHLSFDSILDHLKTIDRFTEIGARELHKAGKRPNLLDVTLRPLFTFFKMYVLKLGFLDGVPGFIVCCLSAFHTFTKYERLYKIA